MGKISATQRLIVEDFPEQRDWIGKMFYVVNDFFQKSISSINGGLEFGSNILGAEKEWDFTYVSHSASLPLKQKWPIARHPKALNVVAAYVGSYTGSLYDSSAVVVSNKQLTPVIANVAWDLNQNEEVVIRDFVIVEGSVPSVAKPAVGQRVVIRVRITP